MKPMYLVVSDVGKIVGTRMAGTAYGIFPTRAEALRFMLQQGLRSIATVEEF